MHNLPSSKALCNAATKLQYPVHFLPRYSIAKRLSSGCSDQKLKFSKSMVKIKSTVLSSLVLGCNSCSDHVCVEYSFFCIKRQMVSAASFVLEEFNATSIALSKTYCAFSKTLVSAARGFAAPPPSPSDLRKRASNSGSASSSDMLVLYRFLI